MKVLMIQPGSPEPPLRDAHGEYADWFLRVEGIDPGWFHVVRLYAGDALPPLADYDAIVVTGASGSVRDPEPWLEPLAGALAGAVREGRPVLGVCYGHQLLGHALGGKVVPNPKGREIGTVRIRLTQPGRSDAILGRLPAGFAANTTHQEIVLDLPGEIQVLAGNDNTAVQAARFGERAWGVQFHPELNAKMLRWMIEWRRETLDAEGFDVDALVAAVREAPRAETVLPRFLGLFR